MITITKREAAYGNHVNVRSENHGDEKIPACDITVSGILLQAHELDAFLGAEAHRRIFEKQTDGFHTPAFPMLDQVRTVREKYEGARVVLYLGLIPTEVVLAPAKLKNVTLEPQAGGLTAIAMTIQATPDPAVMGTLASFMNSGISIEITDAKRAAATSRKQRELPLDGAGGAAPGSEAEAEAA